MCTASAIKSHMRTLITGSKGTYISAPDIIRILTGSTGMLEVNLIPVNISVATVNIAWTK